jgi:hypothetical protein
LDTRREPRRSSQVSRLWLQDRSESFSFALFLRENVPEAKGLIASPCHNSLAVWAASKVEDTVGVAGQRGNLLHSRVLPHVNLILGVAMRTDEFIGVLGKHQVAHLAASLDCLQRLQLQCIPESDRSVLCAATCSEQAVLVRRPRDGFNGGLVLAEASQRLGCALCAPYQ